MGLVHCCDPGVLGRRAARDTAERSAQAATAAGPGAGAVRPRGRAWMWKWVALTSPRM